MGIWWTWTVAFFWNLRIRYYWSVNLMGTSIFCTIPCRNFVSYGTIRFHKVRKITKFRSTLQELKQHQWKDSSGGLWVADGNTVSLLVCSVFRSLARCANIVKANFINGKVTVPYPWWMIRTSSKLMSGKQFPPKERAYVDVRVLGHPGIHTSRHPIKQNSEGVWRRRTRLD